MAVGRLTRGFANPMTTAGDLIRGGTAGAPTRLAKGANGTFLRVSSGGVLEWAGVPAPTFAAVLAQGASANGVTITDFATAVAKLATTLILQGETGAGTGASPALLNLWDAQAGSGDDRRAAILHGGAGPAGVAGGYAAIQAGSGDNLGALGAMVKAVGGQLGARSGWVEMAIGGADGVGFQAIDFMAGSVDPTAAAGVAASTGSLYFRTNGELWQKTAAPDTSWGRAFTNPTSAQVTDTARPILSGTDVAANLDIMEIVATVMTSPGGMFSPAVYATGDANLDLGATAWGLRSPGIASVEYVSLTATRVVTLPPLSTGVNPRWLYVSDNDGSCSAAHKIQITSPDGAKILNGAAGPSPATTIELATPYASICLLDLTGNGGSEGWMIVSRGPVA